MSNEHVILYLYKLALNKWQNKKKLCRPSTSESIAFKEEEKEEEKEAATSK